MVFTQSFAIPCLLFRALIDLDLAAAFDPGLLVAFYAGAVVAFGLGILGARRLFHRRPGEAVAIGFGALFSNSVLLGLPIMERAYGPGALAPSFAIVSIHAPFCYLLGITAMEFARADGRGLAGTMQAVGRAMFRNALMIGLALGFAVNLSGLVAAQHRPRRARHDGRRRFARGAVRARRRAHPLRDPRLARGGRHDRGAVARPAPGGHLGAARGVFALPPEFLRAAVVTAAMAPGVNTYVFASLYARGQAQAASAVLLATGLSVVTVSAWLTLLGGVR